MITEYEFDKKVINKLDNILLRYNELVNLLQDVKIIEDNNKFREYSKELSNLEEIVELYKEYKKYLIEFNDSNEIYNNEKDNQLRDLAKSEMDTILEKFIQTKEKLKKLLIPPDPMANKNIIVEIRAGTGGEEAALFCADLYRMYTRYAEMKKWKTELIDYNDTGLGGFKEIIFSITGKNVYENLRFEYGGHRVQRIPVTESSGRIHTSAVTVAILPEPEETDVEIKMEDLKIDTLRSGGAGGQHVNKTESAVRITHIPTGIVVKCQDNRSQSQNKASALRVLRSKLFEMQMQKIENERATLRKNQVGTGDRSDKIRTYNFPQNRVTDHRINMTLYNLDSFMDGYIDEIIEALKLNFIEEKIKSEF